MIPQSLSTCASCVCCGWCGLWYMAYYLPKVRYFFGVLNNQCNPYCFFCNSIARSLPSKIVSGEHVPHLQEKRKRQIQFVKDETTSQRLRGVAKFDHFEQFWLLTNYLEEVTTDPQVSISCSGRASQEKSPNSWKGFLIYTNQNVIFIYYCSIQSERQQ